MTEASANYYATFIAVAEDCPAEVALEPQQRGARTSAAQIHLSMARDHAGTYTQEQILFRTHLNAKGLDPTEHPEDGETWAAFFSKGRPCLRTSPLAKRYGWGLLFDDHGRVTAVPRGSTLYDDLVRDPELRQLRAMRSSRH